ncbi:MAG TPA: hypothetical protein VFD58_28225 [Blastocatellia bacterium]|nr:hypothetical protein [Blastocatellia bacterium]
MLLLVAPAATSKRRWRMRAQARALQHLIRDKTKDAPPGARQRW